MKYRTALTAFAVPLIPIAGVMIFAPTLLGQMMGLPLDPQLARICDGHETAKMEMVRAMGGWQLTVAITLLGPKYHRPTAPASSVDGIFRSGSHSHRNQPAHAAHWQHIDLWMDSRGNLICIFRTVSHGPHWPSNSEHRYWSHGRINSVLPNGQTLSKPNLTTHYHPDLSGSVWWYKGASRGSMQ